MERKPPLPATAAPRPRPTPADADFLGRQLIPSTLGTERPVTGKLSFSAPTRIDGALRGEVRGTELLVIGKSGSVTGKVRAPHVVVLGVVRGDVRGELVEVADGGRLLGSVEARALVISPGGLFDGDCRMPSRR